LDIRRACGDRELTENKEVDVIMIDFSNIPHDDLLAWVFWLCVVILILLGVDILLHLRTLFGE